MLTELSQDACTIAHTHRQKTHIMHPASNSDKNMNKPYTDVY